MIFKSIPSVRVPWNIVVACLSLCTALFCYLSIIELQNKMQRQLETIRGEINKALHESSQDVLVLKDGGSAGGHHMQSQQCNEDEDDEEDEGEDVEEDEDEDGDVGEDEDEEEEEEDATTQCMLGIVHNMISIADVPSPSSCLISEIVETDNNNDNDNDVEGQGPDDASPVYDKSKLRNMRVDELRRILLNNPSNALPPPTVNAMKKDALIAALVH